MMSFIIAVPNPNICNLERTSFSAPLGSIHPNIHLESQAKMPLKSKRAPDDTAASSPSHR